MNGDIVILAACFLGWICAAAGVCALFERANPKNKTLRRIIGCDVYADDDEEE